MVRNFKLKQQEISELMKADPATERDGGYQGLLVELQRALKAYEITITKAQMERIHRYAFEYKNGGWQGRLLKIFGRVLGPKLDRYL